MYSIHCIPSLKVQRLSSVKATACELVIWIKHQVKFGTLENFSLDLRHRVRRGWENCKKVVSIWDQVLNELTKRLKQIWTVLQSFGKFAKFASLVNCSLGSWALSKNSSTWTPQLENLLQNLLEKLKYLGQSSVWKDHCSVMKSLYTDLFATI